MRGFTLIEIIIYIALFSFIMGAGIITSFYIIDSSARGEAKTNTIAEAEFLMRKIDWAMTGADSVDTGLMEILKDGTEISFDISSNRARIIIDGTPINLTSEWVEVTGLEFISLSSNPLRPEGITASTTIDGKHFEITKYLRE